MKSNKMFLASIFVVLLLMPFNVSATTLKLVTLQYPPYEFEKDGEIKGIAVEIIREAFSRMNQYAFGVVLNISYGSIFDDAVKNAIITKSVISDSAEVNMHRLLEGHFDILVSNTFGAMDILRKMDAQDHVKQLKPSIQRVPSYIAFSKKNNLISVRDRFDRILQEMIKDGSYNSIVKSYFDKGTLH